MLAKIEPLKAFYFWLTQVNKNQFYLNSSLNNKMKIKNLLETIFTLNLIVNNFILIETISKINTLYQISVNNLLYPFALFWVLP